MHTNQARDGLRGGVIGFGVGGALGAAIASRSVSCRDSSPTLLGCGAMDGFAQLPGALIGGLLGGIVGAGIGYHLGGRPDERWGSPEDGAEALRVSIAPAGSSGLRMTASLRF
jgi:hypothetical protein